MKPLLLTLTLGALIGCGSHQQPAADEGMTGRLDSALTAALDTSAALSAAGYIVSGTVRHGVEPGCWVVETADGQSYRPTGPLSDGIRTDGLTVQLRVADDANPMSTCMQGKAVRVLTVLSRR